MTFTRAITPIASVTVFPGTESFVFSDFGGSGIDPFLILSISVINVSECQTYDFETDELSGIGVIKFSYLSHVRQKIRITEEKTMTPILVMQDIASPLSYIYPDITAIGYPEEDYSTKTGKQELNYPRPGGLPVLLINQFDTVTAVEDFACIPRYAMKGNHHFFSDSIVCDMIEFKVRPRVTSGLLVTSYSFL